MAGFENGFKKAQPNGFIVFVLKLFFRKAQNLMGLGVDMGSSSNETEYDRLDTVHIK